MKAIMIREYGDPDVLMEDKVSTPLINEDQILVEMYATSINPVDCLIRAGVAEHMFPITFPHILGLDIAGVVKEVGTRVAQFQQGDRVFGFAHSGSYAEYALSDESSLARISDDISFAEAGALPVVSITAWQSLFKWGNLQPGEKVLIHGGAGGVGHIAIQLAKHIGAYVITTVSARNYDFVKQLGADEVIDYSSTDFSEVVKDVDVVLDSIGGDVEERSFKVLGDGGRLISIISPTISEVNYAGNVVAKFAVIQPNRSDFEKIENLVHEKKLKIHINSVYPLTAAGLMEAHSKSDTKHTNGKLVVQVRE